MYIRITQIDGKLPNLALMSLAAWHREHGDEIIFSRSVRRDLFEPAYDRVYASSIFTYSHRRLARLIAEWPHAIIGGTGSGRSHQIGAFIDPAFDGLDYSIYPDFTASLGFTQRGCRLRCKFCVVPQKEGRNQSVKTIAQVWRGSGHPKKLHLLDNDFFGQEHWRERLAEIRDGGFRVCFNQGINIRLFGVEEAEALASIEYRDDSFRRRRIYTAWDNIGDQRRFFAGIDLLEAAGIPATHVMAYMLIGYDRRETWERIFERFEAMVGRGVRPYPMVYDPSRRDLKRFQRWVVTGLYRAVPWVEYDASHRHESRTATDSANPIRLI